MNVVFQFIGKFLKHRIPWWLGLCLLLSACVYTQPVSAPVGDREKRPIPADGYHQVKRSETLYSIAWLYGLTASQLADWNKISPPYTIYAEQRLHVRQPKPVPKPESRPISVPKPAPKPESKPVSVPKPAITKTVEQSVSPSRPKLVAKPAARQPVQVTAKAEKPKSAEKPEPRMSKRVRWGWPADGGLLTRFNPKLAGRKGISIVGKPGDQVRAAADGKVVYAGSGLSGYGRLIIIKHNQEFLSAYAHNRKLIAKEGEWVKGNQLIAQMGSSGANRTQLYFEIRKDGAPVDPLKYLPKR